MRKGFDGLAVLVQQVLQEKPHSRALFAFRGKRGDLLIETLRGQIARMRRMQFGASSEKQTREIAQLEFALEELETESAVPEIMSCSMSCRCTGAWCGTSDRNIATGRVRRSSRQLSR